MLNNVVDVFPLLSMLIDVVVAAVGWTSHEKHKC